MSAVKLIAGVVALVAAGGAVVVGGGLVGGAGSDDPSPAEAGPGTATETATVVLGDLTADDDFKGTLGFGDEWTLPISADGVVTASWPAGTLIDFGSPLVGVAGVPVLLAPGDTPMYRDLELASPALEGDDVRQLQEMLIGGGFDRNGALEADGVFDGTTRRAVRDWQDTTGRPDTGRVTRGELVFSPVPLRIASDLRVGTAFEPLSVTAWDPVVTVDLSSSERDLLAEGTAVRLELDGGTTVDGTVTGQRTVLADDGSTSVRASITPAGEEVPGDATSVRVVVTNTVAGDVLIVPVGALLALAEGGYAVEVVAGAGSHLVRVEVGAILDGRAEVRGDVAAGDTVVVAG